MQDRPNRLGAKSDSTDEGLYVEFDYGFGTNVHMGFRLPTGASFGKPQHRDLEKMSMSIIGWEKLCELVDEYRSQYVG